MKNKFIICLLLLIFIASNSYAENLYSELQKYIGLNVIVYLRNNSNPLTGELTEVTPKYVVLKIGTMESVSIILTNEIIAFTKLEFLKLN